VEAQPSGTFPIRQQPVASVRVLKYAYILALPKLNFAEVYGPFSLSVSLMFWAFLSGLLLLTGAYLSAQEHLRKN